MRTVVVLLGLAIVIVTLADVIRVTLAVGSRLVPIRVSEYLWMAIGRLVRGRRPMSWLGVAVEVVTVTLWLALMWLGWSLVFLASPDAVVSSSTGVPATGWDRVYFAGYTLFTLGNGDFKPNGPLWQLLAVGTVLSGLSLVTLGITYLLQVVRAVTEKRQLANTIEALGDGPLDIVISAATSGGWVGLEHHFVAMTRDVDLLAQQHLAFPLLHFFRSSTRGSAIAPALAMLDEALLILTCGLPEVGGPNRMTCKPLRYAIRQFLGTVQDGALDGVDAPDPPNLQPLRDAGLETVDDETFHALTKEDEEHRRLMHALVHIDGWRWDELWD